MNELEKYLYRTRSNVLDACNVLDLDIGVVELDNIETCTSCGIWQRPAELRPDLDGNHICKECFRFYGL